MSNNLFYDTSSLTVKEKKALCKKAKSLCYQWWVDKICCASRSCWARTRVDMSFSEIMDKLTSKCHFTVIVRQIDWTDNTPYLEVSFRTMTEDNCDYFLWINIKHDRYFELIQNLELKVRYGRQV